MQICKKNISVCLFLILGLNSLAFAMGIEMPEMPSMPSMPTISFDGTFYRPTLPEKMMGDSIEKSKASENKKDDAKKSDKGNDDILNSLIKNESTLTADDISSLYGAGLFTSLDSLSGNTGLGSLGSDYITTTKTNALLQQVLNELNDLKKVQKEATPAEQQDFSEKQKDSVNFKHSNPSVLRFKINNNDIRDSLVEVFLSTPEEDSSFLLTCDRKYVINNKSRTETFYLLFKNESNTGASVNYKIYPGITQDYKNENSFVYKLCNKNNLTANKIGNLVVMKYNEEGFNVDLLIDLNQN